MRLKNYLKKVFGIFLAVTVSNILVELVFEKNINNLINLKFIIVSLLISLLGALFLKKSIF